MSVVSLKSESQLSLHKQLVDWWSEETEYMFQRVERWATYAKGYNRLRSQRLSRGKNQQKQNQKQAQGQNQTIWHVVDGSKGKGEESKIWSFSILKRSDARVNQKNEETKLNCCGSLKNFNYKSNGNLDGNFLETYSHDHSIYFKTIGDIKNGKKKKEQVENVREEVEVDGEKIEFERPKSQIIDCGDFLASDFDDLDDVEPCPEIRHWSELNLTSSSIFGLEDEIWNSQEYWPGSQNKTNNNESDDEDEDYDDGDNGEIIKIHMLRESDVNNNNYDCEISAIEMEEFDTSEKSKKPESLQKLLGSNRKSKLSSMDDLKHKNDCHNLRADISDLRRHSYTNVPTFSHAIYVK